MEQISGAGGLSPAAAPSQTTPYPGFPMPPEEHRHLHVKETLEWVPSGSQEFLSRQIHQLSGEIQALRELFRERRPQADDRVATKSILTGFDLTVETQNIQRQWILDALAQSRGKVAKAALLLGVSRPSLYDKMRTLGISVATARRARHTKL